jgi:hypothetical protein
MSMDLLIEAAGALGVSGLIFITALGWARVLYWRGRAEDAEAALAALVKADYLDLFV